MNYRSAEMNHGWGRERGVLLSLLLLASALAFTVPALGGLAAAGSTSAYNNVQVSIVTTNSSTNNYEVSAYNSTGGLVASYQSQFPAAAFQIPNGNYIFTALATDQQYGYYPPVPLQSPGASSPPTQTASGAAISPPIKCCIYRQPLVEYGYAVLQVSGGATMTIQTKPVNATPTSNLTVHVKYANGTAAAGAYVSAYVLGDNYGWSYGNSVISLYANTDSQGAASLIAPSVPVLVTAWSTVPIVLPHNQTVIQVTVAGQKVNVTAYWEPNYLTFMGQVLILPQQSAADITLHYQPVQYGVVGYGASSGVSTVSTVQGYPTGSGQTVPPSTGVTTAQQVNTQQPAAKASISGTDIILSVAAVVILAGVLGVALLVTRSRPLMH